ncbi:uncharacterized protein ColSpa_05914 [Colletotrichum spaethianum]|uniref:Uncharacterized protein n=1 Tax=Colletotrichum spaethianum TaxID=700344 RepID=A0AA37LC84_9PEZI|nr:uncharacterized protein ColSpa_05914 [Colletotrichum spaethianum]GKT45733.1 hypothetical protein ColSpa_05914 [Colletotrichum spaethianum]
MNTNAFNDTHSSSNAANYNTYNTKYSNASITTTDANAKLAYQPNTAQTTSSHTSNFPSYDYGRGDTTSQNRNLSYTPNNNPRSGQLYNAQSQTRNTQSYSNNNNTDTSTANPYAQSSLAASQQASTLPSFNSRASAKSSQTRSSTRPEDQQQPQQPQQPQSYGSYSSQTQQQPHQPDQHNWYGFGSGTTTSFTPANVSGGYATRDNAPTNHGASSRGFNQAYQQQQHHSSVTMPGHNYAEGDSDIYELLKNSIHGPGQ